jgi:hypothetical protein
LSAQAQRVREMDRLLNRTESAEEVFAGHELFCSERLRNSRLVLHQNLERLRQVRAQTLQNLLETLAWVRELASMIHLARFTGAPAARTEELLAQIAAAVEVLADPAWQDERFLFQMTSPPLPPPAGD